MVSVPDVVATKIPTLPETPGVYLWKDRDGQVLYVGKAKRLRSRVRSYYAADIRDSIKTYALMRQVADLDTIVVPTEAQALILEANLIKEYHPRFNIALRDDKSYPYIKVTVQEPFPRVFVTRLVESDGGRYFGPYTDVASMRRAINIVKQIFTVRSCRYDMPKEMPERPCLDYFIKRCKAPCVGLQTREDYCAMIDEVVAFLDGRTRDVVSAVRARMEQAASNLEFERAAELRDALARIAKLEEPKTILHVEGGDRDVVGYARDGDDASVALLRIRGGKLLARDHRMMENISGETDAAVLSAYLARAYLSAPDRGPELLVPFDFEDREALESSLPGTRVLVPQRGPKRDLIELGQQNARHLLEEMKLTSDESDERAADPVYDLQRALGLTKVPRAIVCFDISHAQGSDTVASCVWFENGRPKRSEYRKFKVRITEGEGASDVGVFTPPASNPPEPTDARPESMPPAPPETGSATTPRIDDFALTNDVGAAFMPPETRGGTTPRIDDFASMNEVVTRYFRRRLDEEKPLPDLVVIDGGKGQLNAAHAAMESVGLPDLAMVSLAKREEEIFVLGRSESIRLSRRSPGLRMLQQARDEAHRFAITFQRVRRSARTLTSELLKIPGIGPVKRRQLLQAFGSVQGVREATPEQIAAVPGFTPESAQKLLAALGVQLSK